MDGVNPTLESLVFHSQKMFLTWWDVRPERFYRKDAARSTSSYLVSFQTSRMAYKDVRWRNVRRLQQVPQVIHCDIDALVFWLCPSIDYALAQSFAVVAADLRKPGELGLNEPPVCGIAKQPVLKTTAWPWRCPSQWMYKCRVPAEKIPVCETAPGMYSDCDRPRSRMRAKGWRDIEGYAAARMASIVLID